MNIRAKTGQTLFLTGFELRKLLKQKHIMLGVLVVSILTALCATGFYTGMKVNPEQNIEGIFLNELTRGANFSVTVLFPAAMFLLPMLVGIFTTMSFAGELQSGIIRAVSARSMSRFNLIFSKFLAISIYSFCLMALLLLVSYITGGILFGFKGDIVIIGFLFLGKSGGVYVLGGDEGLKRLLLAYLFSWFSLTSLSAFCLMCAAIFKKFAIAAAVSLGLFFTSNLLLSIPFMENVNHYIPTYHLIFWRYVLAKEILWAPLLHDGLITVAFTGASLFVAAVAFRNSDL